MSNYSQNKQELINGYEKQKLSISDFYDIAFENGVTTREQNEEECTMSLHCKCDDCKRENIKMD